MPLLITLVGCNVDPLSRVAVSGTVTLDGLPLASGTITLHPMNDGQSAGGPIVDGKFAIPQPSGPAPGDYRVEIVSFAATGKQIADPDFPGKMRDEVRQIIPADYNRNSTLAIKIGAAGERQLEFPLNSKPQTVARKPSNGS